jgi:hypothetical protein
MRDVWLPFVGPFACLGVVGAWLTMETLGAGRPLEPVALCLLLVTPVTAGLFGAALARGRRKWKGLALGFPVLVVGAGMFNGACIGSILCVTERAHVAEALQMGILMGGICGAAFIPAMFWTFLAAVRVGGARPGSVLDVAFRRAPWAAAAASSSIAVWAVSHRSHGEAPLAVTGGGVSVLALGIVTLVGVLAADVRALLHATQRARLAATPVESHSAHPGEILDLGFGDELLAERLTGPESAYRDGTLHVTRLRGSVAIGKRKLLGIVAVDSLATCAALACVAHLATAASAAASILGAR